MNKIHKDSLRKPLNKVLARKDTRITTRQSTSLFIGTILVIVGVLICIYLKIRM